MLLRQYHKKLPLLTPFADESEGEPDNNMGNNCTKKTNSNDNLPPKNQEHSQHSKVNPSTSRHSPTSSLGRVEPTTEYAWQRKMSFERGLNKKSEARLKLGSISEVWREKDRWEKFVEYLDTISEGEDSNGKTMSLSRYARFLELYVKLDQLEINEETKDEELKEFVLHIKQHEEDFFGAERCLRCIDKAARTEILKSIKLVKEGKMKGGKLVYQPAYSPVLDKLNELLGSYHEAHTLRQTSD